VFWTYQNWVGNIAQVHHESCADCEGGPEAQGVESKQTGKWLGPFERYLDAQRASTLVTTPCERCSPAD
jgi:hypothetical protein